MALTKRGTNKTVSVATDSSSHTSYRFLSTPEKIERICTLKKENAVMTSKIKRMSKKIEMAMSDTNTCTLDDEMSNDMLCIMDEQDGMVNSKYPPNFFLSIFWNTQKRHASKEGKCKNGVRWHPLMIKWCLFLKHQSSKAYETLRQSGISLPSQRTLRDYSNAVQTGTGFS